MQKITLYLLPKRFRVIALIDTFDILPYSDKTLVDVLQKFNVNILIESPDDLLPDDGRWISSEILYIYFLVFK